jgi:HD domain-containing protein
MGILGDIGTLAWARRTNGILGRGERARFVAAVMLEQARGMPRVLAAKGGRSGAGGPDPSELAPPDSAAARDAIEACGELAPAVVEHSYRCHLYARALAIVEGVACDEEAVFVAAMLHDYGMKGIDSLHDRCFTLPGADEALAVGERAGWEAARREAAAEAITFHLNPAVPITEGSVQHLVHDGIVLDVVGLRAPELDADGIRRVRDRHPRLEFNRVGGGMLRDHGRRVSGCRAGALFATGFGLALRLGPWQD